MTRAWSDGDAALDRGLHLGDGLFETILVAAGTPVRLDAHLQRMRRSADRLGIAVPADLDAKVRAAAERLLREEGGPPRAALRVVLTRGPWAGLEPTAGPPGLHVALAPLGPAPDTPLRLVVLDRPRIDPAAPLSGHKTLSWMSHVEARRAARAIGADAALLLTTDGDVAETDAANLFVVLAGRVVTPSLDRGVLPGITRMSVLETLRARGVPSEERRLPPGEMESASEVFVSSSLGGVRAVAAVGPRSYAAPGPVTASLAAALASARTATPGVGPPG